MMNTKLFLALLFSALFILSACEDDDIVLPDVHDLPCVPATMHSNVIAFYPFTNGSLADFSGHGHDLTNPTAAAPAADRDGNASCAYEFDGRLTQDEFLTTTDTDFLNGLDGFTISLWYQPMDSSLNNGVFETLVARDDQGVCPDKSGQWSVGLYDCRRGVFGHQSSVWDKTLGDFGAGHTCEEEVNLRTGNWQFMTATFDKASDEIKIYRNAALQMTAVGAAICASQPVTVEDIGDLFLGKGYTGRLDDVLILNVALDPLKVADLYNMEPCCE